MNQPVPTNKQEEAPYRIYTDEEIKTFVNHDKLPKSFIKDVSSKFKQLIPLE